MSYLNEMVARSIAEERERDLLLELRRRQPARGDSAAHTSPVLPPPKHHGRWHEALVRLHVLHPNPTH